ncbi:MAG: mechanosensitive ion channel family protein [Flavobacteriales bacterium]|nr:mechanosensitive ion channel family protein [Flavobacteriales bacterium]
MITKASVILKNDPTNYKFLSHIITAMIYAVGFALFVYHVPALKAAASSILAGAGIAALAIGLASQQALSNIVSGVFIVLFKPFKVNDRLRLRDTMAGVVEDITLRHTVIRDFENKRIIIPNSVISNEIIVNSDFGEGFICKWIDFQISFNADLEKAKRIMAEEVAKHSNFMDNRNQEQKDNGDPLVPVRVIMVNPYSLSLRAWSWAKDQASAFVLGCDLNESIKKRFDEEGIEIPIPYQKVVMDKNEKLYNA